MSKAAQASLLERLRAIKVNLPEASVFVPEWGETVRLRGLTVRLNRELQSATSDDDTGTKYAIRALAFSIVDDDGEGRPLGSDEGVAIIEGLSERTVVAMLTEMRKLAQPLEDAEKNSEAGAGQIDGSSIGSPSPSAAPSLN